MSKKDKILEKKKNPKGPFSGQYLLPRGNFEYRTDSEAAAGRSSVGSDTSGGSVKRRKPKKQTSCPDGYYIDNEGECRKNLDQGAAATTPTPTPGPEAPETPNSTPPVVATGEETLKWVYGDLSKPRGDDACWEDLTSNMWWYTGVAAFAAMTIWPIIAPIRNVLQFWNWPARGSKAAQWVRHTAALRKELGAGRAISQASLGLLSKVTGKVGTYLASIFLPAAKGIGNIIRGAWGVGAGGIVGTLTGAVGPSKMAAVGNGVKHTVGGSGQVVVGIFQSVKGLGTTLLAIGIIFHLLMDGGDKEEAKKIKKIEDWEGLLKGVVDGALLSEAALEVMMLSLAKGANAKADEKCFFENTLRATAILLLYYAATSTPVSVAKGSSLTVYQTDLKNAKTPAEVLAASKNFHALQIRELSLSLEKQLPLVIREASSGLRNTFKVSLTRAQEVNYINTLLNKGPKAGQDYLKTVVNNKVLRKNIHSAVVDKANVLSTKFADDFKNTINGLEAQVGLRNKLKGRAEAFGTSNKKVLEKLARTIRKANKSTAGSTKNLSAAKLGASGDLSLAQKGVKNDLKTLTKIMDETDSLLYAGGDPLKIVKIYRNNMIPLMNKNASNLDSLIKASLGKKLKNVSDLQSAQVANTYVRYLSSINRTSKKSGFFKAMIEATEGRSLVTGYLRNRNSGLVKTQLSAKEITRILKNQVLKTSKNLKPKDVIKLEKQLLIFHKNVTASVVKTWSIGGRGIPVNEALLNAACTVAITSAVITYLFNQASVEKSEIEDVNNWRSCNLIKSLIWEEYANGRVGKLTKDSSGRIYVPQYAIDSETESIQTLYRYMYEKEHVHVLNKFLHGYLFNAFNGPLQKDNNVKSFVQIVADKDTKDWNPAEFTKEFAKRFSAKASLTKALQAWGDLKGSDRKADGEVFAGGAQYREKYFPIFIKLLVYKSDIIDNMQRLMQNQALSSYYNGRSMEERINFLMGNHPSKNYNGIFTFNTSEYKQFGEKCIEEEFSRKLNYSARESVGQYGDNESITYTSVGEISPLKPLFWNRILYALKPGEFYGEEEEKKVDDVTDSQASQKKDERKRAEPKPRIITAAKDSKSKYKDLDFTKRKHLSMVDCYKLLKKYQPAEGRDLYTEEDIYKLAAIAGGDGLESGGYTKAYNPREAGKDLSYGLWQINMRKSLGTMRRKKYKIQNKDLFNPEINVIAAWDLFLDGARIADNIEQKPGYLKGLRSDVRGRFAPKGVPNAFGHWSVTISTRKGGRKYRKWLKAAKQLEKEIKKGENTMREVDLKDLVKTLIKENYGKGYSPYPYHSHIGHEEEPAEDFIQDWKDFELALVRDESRETAISVAKILIRDLELFGDVLDLVGKNQSVATEILKSLRKNEENS